MRYRGKTALVTGASSGIGEALARELARRGADVVLVARSADRLRALANELSQRYGVRVEVLAADLSREEGVLAVRESVRERGLAVDLLVNNAGFGSYGPFDGLSPELNHREVMLNAAAVVGLTHAFLPHMLDRGEGAIVNVASTTAFQPGPYMAVYAASKSFVLSFSESLWAECRRRGVRVLALCPGPVATGFWKARGGKDPRLGALLVPVERADRVARIGLMALERGRPYVVPGFRNYLFAQASRFVPRSWAAHISELVMGPRRKGRKGQNSTSSAVAE